VTPLDHHELPDEIVDRQLIDRLVRAIELPGPFVAVTLAGRYKGFKKALAQVPGAEIYRA
jgi:hypothetical protein